MPAWHSLDRVSLNGEDRGNHSGRALHINSAARLLLWIGWLIVISRLFTSCHNPEGKIFLLPLKFLKNSEAYNGVALLQKGELPNPHQYAGALWHTDNDVGRFIFFFFKHYHLQTFLLKYSFPICVKITTDSKFFRMFYSSLPTVQWNVLSGNLDKGLTS